MHPKFGTLSRKQSHQFDIQKPEKETKYVHEEAKSEESKRDLNHDIASLENTELMDFQHKNMYGVKKRPKRHRKYRYKTHHNQLLRVPLAPSLSNEDLY